MKKDYNTMIEHILLNIMNELFVNDPTWARILELFVLCGEMILKYLSKILIFLG